MAGYVVASYRVTDPQGIQRYVEAVMPTLAAHGAEVLVADHGTRSMEGDAPPTLIVMRFASVEAAQGWYDSPEYQAIKHLRLASTENGRLAISEGFLPPD